MAKPLSVHVGGPAFEPQHLGEQLGMGQPCHPTAGERGQDPGACLAIVPRHSYVTTMQHVSLEEIRDLQAFLSFSNRKHRKSHNKNVRYLLS